MEIKYDWKLDWYFAIHHQLWLLSCVSFLNCYLDFKKKKKKKKNLGWQWHYCLSLIFQRQTYNERVRPGPQFRWISLLLFCNILLYLALFCNPFLTVLCTCRPQTLKVGILLFSFFSLTSIFCREHILTLLGFQFIVFFLDLKSNVLVMKVVSSLSGVYIYIYIGMLFKVYTWLCGASVYLFLINRW